MDNNLRIYTNKRINRSFNLLRMLSVTNWLIIFNVLLFFLYLILKTFVPEQTLLDIFAISGKSFFSGKVWTLLTSMFMHGGFAHLAFNMISLFFIGNFVERIIGRKRFLWFYVLSGLFAGIFYVTLSNFFGFGIFEKIFLSPATYAVGASGAIFGLLGLLAVLTPYNKVYLIVGPLIAIVIESLLAYIIPNSSYLPLIDTIVTIYFVLALFAMFSFNRALQKLAIPVEMSFWVLPLVAIVPLIVIGIFFPLPIGNTAHLGGLIAGLIYGNYLRKKYKKKTTFIREYFSNRR